MARGQKKRSKRQPKKGPRGAKCEDCPVLHPKKTPKKPIIERTETRGLVDLKFPGFEAKFPGTNRSVMVILCTGICSLVIIIPIVFYQVFSADPEALERVGEFFGDEKPREPVKVPVQTNDGIEIISVCPPLEREECEERFGDFDCPDCQCPACPQCPAAPLPPPRMAPLPGGKGAALF